MRSAELRTCSAVRLLARRVARRASLRQTSALRVARTQPRKSAKRGARFLTVRRAHISRNSRCNCGNLRRQFNSIQFLSNLDCFGEASSRVCLLAKVAASVDGARAQSNEQQFSQTLKHSQEESRQQSKPRELRCKPREAPSHTQSPSKRQEEPKSGLQTSAET